MSNQHFTIAYDALGRVKSRSINSVGQAWNYDELGRVTSVTNALGTFTNTYVNTTSRLSSVGYPNGQTNYFSYHDNAGDQRLEEIWNKNGSGGTFSKFNYGYNALGMITNWTQQVDSDPSIDIEFKYDQVNQLNAAIKKLSSSGAIQKEYRYAYDPAGNRISEQIKSAGAVLGVQQAVYNTLNQLTALKSGGKVHFEGTTDENAEVTVGGSSGNAGTLTNTFKADVNVSGGGGEVSVIARDYSGNDNTSTNRYGVSITESVAKTFSYDANGNTTSITEPDLTKTFTWDAADRLIGISTNGTEVVSFTYDGMGRRNRMINRVDATNSTTNYFLWCGMDLCEERDHTGGTVTKRYFGQGFQVGSTNLFYTRDHLGSIREVVANDGSTVEARYDYDPYGRRTLVSGSDIADFGYTGHYYHKGSELALAPFRAYDPDLGRWLSRDPIAEDGGLICMRMSPMIPSICGIRMGCGRLGHMVVPRCIKRQ